MFYSLKESYKKRQLLKAQKLREKNAQLREEGKDPLNGWGKMVNTGFGGLNSGGSKANGTVDLTGGNLGTMNFFSEEQKQLAKENDKKNR